jgi:hypothetical protein
MCASAPVEAQNSGVDATSPSIIDKPMSPPPVRSQAPVDAHVREVRADLHPPVHFVLSPKSEKMDLTLYQERGMNAVLGPGGNRNASEFLPLCTLPCDLSLRAKPYVFGVSTGDRGAVKVSPVLQLKDSQRVVVQYNSRLPLRVFGWVLLLAGTAAGGLLLGAGVSREPSKPGWIAGGAVLMSVSLGGGLWFANTPDSAKAWIER